MAARGNFFAIDLPTFDKVCGIGDPDVAAAYLVLAAGTGADNRTSTWSREAINKRTNLNWRKADAAIAKLEKAGLARWLVKGTRKPRIDLTPVDVRGFRSRAASEVVQQVRKGEVVSSKPRAIQEALDSGHLVRDESGRLLYVEAKATIPVWLPNSLVGDELGRPIEGTTIVERIRKSRDPLAFHLLAHLAHCQDMAELWGIDRYVLGHHFKSEKIHRTANLDVVQFTRGTAYMRWTKDTIAHQTGEEAQDISDFFSRVRLLEDVGALEWTYFVAEDDAHDSILMTPVALIRHDKPVKDQPETITGLYATAAASALAERSWQDWEAVAPDHFLMPVDRMNRKAAMVGVPRLRGMAKTSNAKRWQAERMSACREWIATFRGILIDHDQATLDALDLRFADFNVEFNGASTFVQSDINDSSLSDMHGPRPSDERDTGSKKAGML